ncbi:hypothetical protein [Lacrimispora sp.]|uniref:hypothetical protein n=1 Tax=Lacrimispora sp. TaxID=2719234 RepID=UPI0028ACA4CF|nr:hypothetical protein [Lacrimispora sp.]
MKKKVVILVGMVSLSLLGGLGGLMTSYAAGPGETQETQTVAKPETYNQQSVKALGQWEPQSNGTWVFRQFTGGVLVDSWIESLTEQGAYYYVGTDGVMLINSRTPDGYNVDANGLWRDKLTCTAPSVSENSTNSSNKNTNRYSDEVSSEALEMMERYANMSHGNLH